MGNNDSKPANEEQKPNKQPDKDNNNNNNTNTKKKQSTSTKDEKNDKNKKKEDEVIKPIVIDINSLTEYTMEEVEKHTSKQTGVWIVLNKLVYDVTPFLSQHPGGPGFLLEVAGEDGTQEFQAAIHSEYARNKAKEFVIGKLKQDKTKKQGLSIPSSLNPTQNNVTKPPSKYPPSSNYNSNNNNSNNSSSSKSKSKQIKFTNMSNDVLILFGTQKGTAKHFATTLYNKLNKQYKNKNILLSNMKNYDAEDLEKESIVIMITSTYENGEAPNDAKYFMQWINEAPSDCRVHDLFLQKLRMGVFGLGNSLYDDDYNKVSKLLYKNLLLLGAAPLIQLGLGDNNVSRNDAGNQTDDFKLWMNKILIQIKKALNDPKYPKNVAAKKRKPIIMTMNKNNDDHELADMEDIANLMKNSKNMNVVVDDDEKKELDKKIIRKEMVTTKIRESLTKQGYKVIGSHSGVKLCRWTKSMLRGRGGCYKNTFYGIKSYSCMEMTPSLACANKCVFCWRHHTNPVGKQWKWVTDEPQFILDKAIANHKQMVKAMKGVPGVLPDRLKDAQQNIRHCALSLVGEPIMYPHINEYLRLLHSKKISSFLVTNAQFPEKIINSEPITQLYVSVDAATRESLKAVDRPLFKDYWERFLASLDALKHKNQRTVYRLTLVKKWNNSEVADYARLIARGLPTFIEVKGVTFCGKSDGSNLTMDNVPFHFEVVRFCEKLCEYLSSDYAISCEHAHSCCVLISKKELKINGQWHTHIDYAKFFELLQSGKEFGYKDYMAPTPKWAVIGAKEQGFNPNETKFVKKRHKNRSNEKRKASTKLLQNKIEKAKQAIEIEKKQNIEIVAENNPYLIGKKENCNDCNCKNDEE